MKNWQIGVKNLLNIFLKSNCLLCDRPCDEEICKYCHGQLMGCKINNPGGWWRDEKLFIWGKYTGILKRMIAVMKYENKPQLGEILGKSLGEAWIKYSLSQLKPIVVPIPMHPEKQKKRGYNQADLIAEGFCHYTGLKLEKQALERIINTAAQYQQSSVKEREKNLAGAFKINPRFNQNRKQSILLLDDIYTTGTTVKEAAKVLEQKGMKVEGVVAIATSRIDNRQLTMDN